MKKEFLAHILLVCSLPLVYCGIGRKSIKAYPGPERSADQLAYIDLRSPEVKLNDNAPPLRFRIRVDSNQYEAGLRRLLRIKTGTISVEIEGEEIEQIQLDAWIGLSDKMRPHKKYGTAYLGKRIFYPDKKVELIFNAKPGGKYRFKFQLQTGDETTGAFAVECSIIEKGTKRVVSNTGQIKYH